MACLINSIDELPKVIEEIPDDAADMDAFFGAYTIIANGKELLYDDVASENSWYIYFVPKDESIDGELSILCELPSKEVGINGHSGYFETLSSLSMCEKGSEEQTICGTPICDEGKEGLVITPTSTKLGNEYAGTSDKAKPTGVPQYSLYLELDTGKFYYYDNGEWNEIPCGGGGSESNKAKIIIDNSEGDVAVSDIFIGPCEFPPDPNNFVPLGALPVVSEDETVVELDASDFIGRSMMIWNDGDNAINVTGLLNETIDIGQLSSQCFTMLSGDTLSIINHGK